MLVSPWDTHPYQQILQDMWYHKPTWDVDRSLWFFLVSFWMPLISHQKQKQPEVLDWRLTILDILIWFNWLCIGRSIVTWRSRSFSPWSVLSHLSILAPVLPTQVERTSIGGRLHVLAGAVGIVGGSNGHMNIVVSRPQSKSVEPGESIRNECQLCDEWQPLLSVMLRACFYFKVRLFGHRYVVSCAQNNVAAVAWILTAADFYWLYAAAAMLVAFVLAASIFLVTQTEWEERQ